MKKQITIFFLAFLVCVISGKAQSGDIFKRKNIKNTMLKVVA